MQTKIDYYGDKDNYIHLKFGDAVKMYNFTKEFREKYPQFVRAYEMYWVCSNNMTTQYDKLIDALNLIDEQADRGCNDNKEGKQREKAYNLVANFIDKYAKR